MIYDLWLTMIYNLTQDIYIYDYYDLSDCGRHIDNTQKLLYNIF